MFAAAGYSLEWNREQGTEFVLVDVRHGGDFNEAHVPGAINLPKDPTLKNSHQLLAEKLKAEGVAVNYQNYEGVTHEFFRMGTVVDEAKDAVALAACELKKSFSTTREEIRAKSPVSSVPRQSPSCGGVERPAAGAFA